MKFRNSLLILVLLVSLPVQAKDSLPDWAVGAVWYHILPERFRNIYPANDPIKERVIGKEEVDWQVHPWASDWYKLQIWEEERGGDFSQLTSDRRYGGDLIGVIEKLPYLKNFGVDVILLTPIFEAPSIEKYDAVTFHHVDNNFGLDRQADWEKIISEKEDPESWTLTKGDEVFIELVTGAHNIGIKIVIEAVFNYCGREFWAFKDVEENQQDSKYKDWFEVASWDDFATPDTVEFDYKCWQNDKNLPLFKKDEKGGLVEPVRDYLFNITKRWMDPNDDGTLVDGIDGWYVNHMQALPPIFLDKWVHLVKSINSNALVVSDASSDVAQPLKEEYFDLMRNDNLTKLMLDFFVNNKLKPSDFVDQLQSVQEKYDDGLNHSLITQIDHPGTFRLASKVTNAAIESASNGNNGNDIYASQGEYNPLKPDSTQRKIRKLLTVFYLTYIGSPMIFYGDESGMWGGNYPDNIKPMLWKEFLFEKETYQPFASFSNSVSENRFDQSLFDLYRKLNHVRQSNLAVRKGDFIAHTIDDEKKIFGYSRKYKKNEVLVFFNLSDETQNLKYKPDWKKNTKIKDPLNNKKIQVKKFTLHLELPPKSFKVFVK